MKTIASIFIVLLIMAGCSSMPKGTMEQTAAWGKVASDSVLAGTVSVSQDSGILTINVNEIKIELGRPMMVYPRLTNSGLELDVFMLGPEYKPGIEAENF